MKKANNKPAKKTAKKSSSKKSVNRTRHPKVFGEFTPSSTLRALGKAGVKNADGAAKAIKRYAKGFSPKISLVRSLLYVGRKNLGSAPAALSKVQIAQLKKAAA